MQASIDRRAIRRRIRYRIRARFQGTAARPRLAVYRSDKHIYVQAIDDQSGRTVAHASSIEDGLRAKGTERGKIPTAKAVGGAIAERLKGKGIEAVVFDRGGYLYHGRIRALADAAREAGLKF